MATNHAVAQKKRAPTGDSPAEVQVSQTDGRARYPPTVSLTCLPWPSSDVAAPHFAALPSPLDCSVTDCPYRRRWDRWGTDGDIRVYPHWPGPQSSFRPDRRLGLVRVRRRISRELQRLWFFRRGLSALDLGVVPDIRIWSAPGVKAALAGLVHRRQASAGDKHYRRENDQQGRLHCGLATAGPEPIGRALVTYG